MILRFIKILLLAFLPVIIFSQEYKELPVIFEADSTRIEGDLTFKYDTIFANDRQDTVILSVLNTQTLDSIYITSPDGSLDGWYANGDTLADIINLTYLSDTLDNFAGKDTLQYYAKNDTLQYYYLKTDVNDTLQYYQLKSELLDSLSSKGVAFEDTANVFTETQSITKNIIIQGDTIFNLNDTVLVSELDSTLGVEKTDREIYIETVGNGGSDISGDGSSGSPYATLTKAVSAIKQTIDGATITMKIGTGSFNADTLLNELYKRNYVNSGAIDIHGDSTAVVTGITLSNSVPINKFEYQSSQSFTYNQYRDYFATSNASSFFPISYTSDTIVKIAQMDVTTFDAIYKMDNTVLQVTDALAKFRFLEGQGDIRFRYLKFEVTGDHLYVSFGGGVQTDYEACIFDLQSNNKKMFFYNPYDEDIFRRNTVLLTGNKAFIRDESVSDARIYNLVIRNKSDNNTSTAIQLAGTRLGHNIIDNYYTGITINEGYSLNLYKSICISRCGAAISVDNPNTTIIGSTSASEEDYIYLDSTNYTIRNNLVGLKNVHIAPNLIGTPNNADYVPLAGGSWGTTTLTAPGQIDNEYDNVTFKRKISVNDTVPSVFLDSIKVQSGSNVSSILQSEDSLIINTENFNVKKNNLNALYVNSDYSFGVSGNASGDDIFEYNPSTTTFTMRHQSGNYGFLFRTNINRITSFGSTARNWYFADSGGDFLEIPASGSTVLSYRDFNILNGNKLSLIDASGNDTTILWDDGDTTRIESNGNPIKIGNNSLIVSDSVKTDGNIVCDTLKANYVDNESKIWNDTILDISFNSSNTFIGNSVATSVTTGASSNTSIGKSSGENLTTGDFNTYVGTNAGKDNSTSDGNVFIGRSAGQTSTGEYNVFIGHESGYAVSDSNVLYIHNDSGTPLIYGEFDNNYLKVTNTVETEKFDETSPVSLKAYSATSQNIVVSVQNTWYHVTNGTNDFITGVYNEQISLSNDTVTYNYSSGSGYAGLEFEGIITIDGTSGDGIEFRIYNVTSSEALNTVMSKEISSGYDIVPFQCFDSSAEQNDKYVLEIRNTSNTNDVEVVNLTLDVKPFKIGQITP